MMKLTRISTTSSPPEFEYGAFHVDKYGMALRAIRTSHRAIIDWIAEQPDSLSYQTARRMVPRNEWDHDWAED